MKREISGWNSYKRTSEIVMAIGEFKKAQNNFCLSDFSKRLLNQLIINTLPNWSDKAQDNVIEPVSNLLIGSHEKLYF